jgi:hypothetical protein
LPTLDVTGEVGHPDTLPRWQYRSVPGASSDGNAEYLARMEERQRHDLMCYLRGDVHGFPNRFRAGTLRFTTDGLKWRPMWSIQRKWMHLPPLDRVIEFRPWGIPGDPEGGKFRYKRKVVTASGPLGTIQFALRGLGVNSYVDSSNPMHPEDRQNRISETTGDLGVPKAPA